MGSILTGKNWDIEVTGVKKIWHTRGGGKGGEV